MAKIYKSINTILEKAKQGSLYQNTTKFSNLVYFKPPELISPYLHNVDKSALSYYLESIFNEVALPQDNLFMKIKDSLFPNGIKNEEVLNIYKTIPKSIFNDIFNQFYSKNESLRFENRTEYNKKRFMFTDVANSPVSKIITEHSCLKSAIYTKYMIYYYLSVLVKLKNESEDDYQKALDDLKNDKDSNQSNSQTDSDFQDAINNTSINDLMDKANDENNNVNEVLTDAEQKETWESLSNKSRSGFNRIKTNDVTQASEKISKLNLNTSSLKNPIKKILDKTISYFDAKSIPIYDEFLNSPFVDDIINYELLHPTLRKVLIDDIQVKSTKKIGKINVYLDISGSMDCSINDELVTRLEFAQALVLKLKKMGIINEMYVFTTSIKKREHSITSLLTLNANGGTNIDTVIENIIKTDKNALIITDADDYINYYTDKAFFIGVPGCRFSRIRKENRDQYIKNKQLIYFDGNKICNIDDEGNPIL